MKLLGHYKNGNYQVNIYDDGTKVRVTDDNEFIADFPESMDVKITNKCGMMCPYCHENSTPDGLHASLVAHGLFAQQWMRELHPYTEMAIGGGNPLSHPDLEEFLFLLNRMRVLPNLTVNYFHFVESYDMLCHLDQNLLIRGLGISINSDCDVDYKKIERFPNAVLHLVAGVDNIEFIRSIPKTCKVLFLGYKDFGRGKSYLIENPKVQENILALKEALPTLGFKITSLDNLAIEQLKPEEWLSKEDWEQRYMGEDGTNTMYIDAVKQEYAVSSTSQKRFKINLLKEAFNHVKEAKNVN